MSPRYLVYVTGNRPFAIDWWSKPYKTLPAATAQRTRFIRGGRSEKKGDWVGDIYELTMNAAGEPVLTKVDI